MSRQHPHQHRQPRASRLTGKVDLYALPSALAALGYETPSFQQVYVHLIHTTDPALRLTPTRRDYPRRLLPVLAARLKLRRVERIDGPTAIEERAA